jgi:hypothetical protein
MKNLPICQEENLLEIFQVEELEKRFEMGEWSISASSRTNTSTGETIVEGKATLTFGSK